ncbi:hypothetical protein F5Y16DRAFT_212335 [Xylariaceae sp. FL0255]|nr:hypothetical protein F5Y16DRAFT_212335 [Xylariaceae sp. FL0255]
MTAEPDTSTTSISSSTLLPKTSKNHELAKTTIKSPLYSYAHLQLYTSSPLPNANQDSLDALQVRSYCTAALKQFLGATGTAIQPDILKVQGQDCWIRVPREDLRPFAAAITAWQGASENGEGGSQALLRIQGCSDWLGALVGQEDEQKLWTD